MAQLQGTHLPGANGPVPPGGHQTLAVSRERERSDRLGLPRQDPERLLAPRPVQVDEPPPAPYSEESVITGIAYDGRMLSMETGESRGKNMIDPLLVSGDGRLLDMYDFA